MRPIDAATSSAYGSLNLREVADLDHQASQKNGEPFYTKSSTRLLMEGARAKPAISEARHILDGLGEDERMADKGFAVVKDRDEAA